MIDVEAQFVDKSVQTALLAIFHCLQLSRKALVRRTRHQDVLYRKYAPDAADSATGQGKQWCADCILIPSSTPNMDFHSLIRLPRCLYFQLALLNIFGKLNIISTSLLCLQARDVNFTCRIFWQGQIILQTEEWRLCATETLRMPTYRSRTCRISLMWSTFVNGIIRERRKSLFVGGAKHFVFKRNIFASKFDRNVNSKMVKRLLKRNLFLFD